VDSGKAIALRLAGDGYDICVNDVKANEQGANEVSGDILFTCFNRDGVVECTGHNIMPSTL